MPEWLTVSEACARVKVTRRTLYHWMTDGRIVWCYTASKQSRRILAASLLIERHDPIVEPVRQHWTEAERQQVQKLARFLD